MLILGQIHFAVLVSGHCCQQPQGKELLPPVSLQARLGPPFLQLTANKVHTPVSLRTPPLTAQDEIVRGYRARLGVEHWEPNRGCICGTYSPAAFAKRIGS